VTAPPSWPSVLAVVAHPDDETFGLGAVIDLMTQAGTSAHIVCYTHGEASTLNETGTSLHGTRCRELELASTQLRVATVDLLDYGDGRLAGVPRTELAGHVTRAVSRYHCAGLLVFDETGVTGHADHQAATAAAVHAADSAGLPVLAWALPERVARVLREETGQPFAGQPPSRLDLCLRVDRAVQCQAALVHASQISPGAVLWRRLELLGDHEYLRWLRRPGTAAALPGIAP
jgi:N-acetylglucosamine malate deacetylase 2